jgi:membrane protein DedA with SNARE-associated domain
MLSSLIWASIFTSIGWFFGLGAERLIGDALKTITASSSAWASVSPSPLSPG